MTRSKKILILLVSLIALAATAPAASSAMTPNPRGYAEPGGIRWGSQPDFRYIRFGSGEPKGAKIRIGAPAALKGKAEPEASKIRLGTRVKFGQLDSIRVRASVKSVRVKFGSRIAPNFSKVRF